MKWMPKDVIAVIIVICCFTLLILGKDSVVSWTLLGVVGAYYGIDLSPWFRIGRNQKHKKEDEK
ncbi:hypothetical protein ES708_01449 [subsurface metagenome]